MQKRLMILFVLLMLGFSGLVLRIYSLMEGETLKLAASRQGSYSIVPVSKRGMIYDCDMRALVNTQISYRAAIIPSPESGEAVFDKIRPEDKQLFLTRMEEGRPFSIAVTDPDIFHTAVLTFESYERYQQETPMPHILGYLDAAGNGVTGIEESYNEYLEQTGGQIRLTYQVDAVGRALESEKPKIADENYSTSAGVVLSLDSEIQSIAREALLAEGHPGAVVIMDVDTGAIKADVSLPDFQPDSVADYIDSENGELLNRALLAYNVGSTFKLVTAAAALESGISPLRTYVCTGSHQVGDVVFHCNDRNGHGEINMKHALEVSCNTYFIDLGLEIGYEKIYALAREIGFGGTDQLASAIVSSAGSLPYPDTVVSPAETANISFGQGRLTASPLQIARLIATIANGGYSVSPHIVLGLSNEEGTKIASYERQFGVDRILSESTVSFLQECMRAVVETGSGRAGQPTYVTAAAKTATAETGQYKDGAAVVHAWFSGYFPADNPQYAVVVFVEGGGSGALTAGPIFKEIADRMAQEGHIDKFSLDDYNNDDIEGDEG